MKTTLLRSKWVLLLGAAAVLSLSAGDALAGRPHHSSGTSYTASATPYRSYPQASVAQPFSYHRPAVVPQPLPWRRGAVSVGHSNSRYHSSDRFGSGRELQFLRQPVRSVGWGRSVGTIGYSSGGLSIQIIIR